MENKKQTHTHKKKKKISKFFHLSLEPKKSQFFHRLLLQPRRVLCCSLIKPCPTFWDLMGCSISGCPSLFPGVCLNSCLLSQWCHLIISSSVIPFSSCLWSFPGSGSFPVSHLFASGGQKIEASASASILPKNIQSWFPWGLTGWSAQAKVLSRVFSSTTIWKHPFFSTQPSLWSNSHIHPWLMNKPQIWQSRPLSAKWCLCFLICCLVLSQLSFQRESVF